MTYQVYGKGHTLPSFWTLCDRCEGIYRAGETETAVELMKEAQRGFWRTAEDVDQMIRRPLAVFTRADGGARRLR